MAGGTFIAQNKVRPGAYINFKAVSAPAMSVGERGVAAMPLATGWGPDFIELYSEELLSGKSLSKVGCTYVDEEALVYRLVLSNTYKLLIARSDIGVGKKASATIGDLKVEAINEGEAGNGIVVSVSENSETGKYDVVTNVGGEAKDTQSVEAISELTSNEFVSFSDVGEGVFTPTEGTRLSGGENECKKASATVGNLVVTAKYKGAFGNRISVIIAKVGDTSNYDVTTAVDGIGKNTQRVTTIESLVGNDWVDFSVDDPEESMTPTETSGTALTGGVSGTESSQSISSAIAVLATKTFNVLGCMSSETTVKQYIKTTIRQLREDEGRKCKAVVLDYGGLSGADYEGIISCKQGYKTQDGEITAAQFAAQLTGMSAGAELGVSLTHKVIEGAVEVVGEPKTNADIIEALKTGWLVLSQLNDGTVIIEQDINTLCNDLTNKDDSFRKNLIINTNDEIGNTIQLTWDKTYCGKVHNNPTQRENYRAALIEYFRTLERLELIQDFDKDSDIIVNQGENLNSVVVDWWVKHVDVMEKVYMTTNIRR